MRMEKEERLVYLWEFGLWTLDYRVKPALCSAFELNFLFLHKPFNAHLNPSNDSFGKHVQKTCRSLVSLILCDTHTHVRTYTLMNAYFSVHKIRQLSLAFHKDTPKVAGHSNATAYEVRTSSCPDQLVCWAHLWPSALLFTLFLSAPLSLGISLHILVAVGRSAMLWCC